MRCMPCSSYWVLGAGLRFWQYIANKSLWLDEILLASNILPALYETCSLSAFLRRRGAQGFSFVKARNPIARPE
jgi:hypothetical protein